MNGLALGGWPDRLADPVELDHIQYSEYVRVFAHVPGISFCVQFDGFRQYRSGNRGDGIMWTTLIAIGLLCLVTLLPLVPAIVIYRLFPNTVVATSGPLSGLTLKSSGAFSIYIIVLLATAPFTWKTYDVSTRVVSPNWTVRGVLELIGANGKPIKNPHALNGMSVSFNPSVITTNDGSFTLNVPEKGGALPNVVFGMGQQGASDVIDLNTYDKAHRTTDASNFRIKLSKPVKVYLY